MKRFVLFAIFSSFLFTKSVAHAGDDCPEPAAEGTQPCDGDIQNAFARAATNTLGEDGPDLGMIGQGRPSMPVTARFPCALLAAIGQVESTWRQFSATGTCGGTGPTLISSDCGYGIMQITSGMDGTGGFDPPSVAADPIYNIGTGARILGQKWRTTPFVGENNPDVIECWYYAVWAYNGFSYINNPHNPRYPAARMPYRSEGTGARSDYPYQEIVWGYLRSPVSDRWPAIEVSYPNLDEICGTAMSCFPGNLTMPTPGHTGVCSGEPIPYDAGMPDSGLDASVDGSTPDAGGTDASAADASRDATVDANNDDAGAIPKPPESCNCEVPSSAGGKHNALVLFALALLLMHSLRKRARQ